MEFESSVVRPGEELNVPALSEYLRTRLPEPGGPLAIKQFPHGHSNLVYLIRAGQFEYVLRRPPLGPVPPRTHDMAREFRVLQAIHPQFPEAPAPVLLCEESDIIGAPFLLMERRRGVVLRTSVPAAWEPGAVSRAFVDCLVRLHAVDAASAELRALGKAEGFVQRQVRGWAERWQAARTEPLEQMEAVIGWLGERIPPPHPPTLVHNDFKLDNVMFAPSGDRVTAVLDWEMATLGDPLADVGLALCYWVWAAIAYGDDPHPATPVISRGAGWFTRDDFVRYYAERTGRNVTHVSFYEVLGVFKLAVILQQIYVRYHRGQTKDDRFRDFDRRVRALVRQAVALVERQG